MFKRRHKKTFLKKMRDMVWPSMHVMRLVSYYKHRIARLKEPPVAIAAGFACGVAVSFTPFIGLHLLIGAVMAWAVGGSLMAMVVGTVLIGNPWTFPLIWVVTYTLGRYMLGEVPHLTHLPERFTFYDLLHKPVELMLPMLLGSFPFIVVFSISAFYFARHVVTRYKDNYPNIKKKIRERAVV